MTTKERFDPYVAVTDQIIALLEAGTPPWRQPWSTAGGMPRSLSTGKPYRGINPFLLLMTGMEKGYTNPWWGTFDQIKARGGMVRKGEKGTMIIFWRTYPDKTEIDPRTGKPVTRFALRSYKVFNVEQADAQDGQTFNVPEVDTLAAKDTDPIEACEQAIAPYVKTLKAVEHGHQLAAYVPAQDRLVMPDRDTFTGAPEYYSTYFHELSHSTGHPTRLNRKDLNEHTHFGDQKYSKEELTAEFGSAFLAGQTGIITETIENSAAYINGWLTKLKSDPKLVVRAAAQAQRAADLVLGVTHEQDATATEQAA